MVSLRKYGRMVLLTLFLAVPVLSNGWKGGAVRDVSAAGKANAPTLSAEKYVLPNGLEVILHEDHRTPVVAVNIWYHVGSKDEPRGKNGFAHLFEHVMFQGSRNVAEDTFFKYLEGAGASERNGTTNSDRTNYFEAVPSNELGLVLWLESDRMGFLLDHTNEGTFASQREVVKNERRQNYENAPYGLVPQFLHAELFSESHPYHLLTIGSPHDLDAATLDDVREFFRTYYVPNNATLVIAGDLDRAKTKELVAKYFATIPRGKTPKIFKDPMVPTLLTEKRLVIEAQVELPRVYIAWPTPPGLTQADAELDLAARVLSNGKTSRLYKRLVYDAQIAQDVHCNQGSMQLASTFEVVVTLKSKASPEDALKMVDDEFAKLRAAPPEAAEFDRAKVGMMSDLVFSNERITSRANMLNHYNQATGDPEYFDKDLARYDRVQPVDVQKAMTTHVPEFKRVVAIVNPTPGAPRAGRLAPGKSYKTEGAGK